MNNYYETCIQEIREAISSKRYEAAQQRILEELRMPYVPEPYLSQLEALQQTLPHHSNATPRFFETAEEIEAGLRGNADTVNKALMSLNHLNIRAFWNQAEQWCLDPALDDAVKKQIVLIGMEQGLGGSLPVYLNGTRSILDLDRLQSPFENKAFLSCLSAIHDKLESSNPSLLLLCQAELETEVFTDFPFFKASYDADALITRVEGYLNATD